MAAISGTLSNWIQPGHFTVEAGKFFSTNDGTGDLFEALINVFDWMTHFGNPSTKIYSEELEIIHNGLGIFDFISSLGDLRNQFQHFQNDSVSKQEIFKTSLKSVVSGCKTAFFLDGARIVPLEGMMKGFEKAFAGSLFLLGGIGFFHHKGLATTQKQELEKALGPEEKNILSHKVQLAYANMLKAVNTIALASITLVSLLFAFLAKGFLFSTVVSLSLTSTWIALSFATHFYEKMIDHWELNSPGFVRI